MESIEQYMIRDARELVIEIGRQDAYEYVEEMASDCNNDLRLRLDKGSKDFDELVNRARAAIDETVL